MIVSVLALFVAFSPQAPPPVAARTYVVSILNERNGEDTVLRFVMSGAPNSYSATREGDEVLVRIEAEPLPGMSLPAARGPITAIALGTPPGFTLRVTVAADIEHEIVREMASVRLVLRKPVAVVTPSPSPTPTPQATLDALVIPSPTPAPSPSTTLDSFSDTADLYRRLFPTSSDPSASGVVNRDLGASGNWYSDFSWLGLQARPWVSVSYVDGKTTQVQLNEVTSDSYWVVQPNLGLGFNPRFGGPREGQWSINYTPRFRRLINLTLPRLTSHFFDVGLDQPVASFGSVYGTYHLSRGVLETDEVDPGREYGIGLNRVIDTSLERFRRTSLGLGVRFDFVAETKLDVSVNKTAVRYGNDPADAPFTFGERAFFNYDTRTLNASLRRGFGESRFLSVLYGIHDTPKQKERAQVEGRGYTYGASLEGEMGALVTGRVMLGYRTQKNPNAGTGGQNYKDLTYGAQLVRQLSEDTTFGVGADRNLYLSAYEGNGFYVADTLRGDLGTSLPFSVFLRGSLALQSNGYKASPQLSETSGLPTLRKDKIRTWSIGLTRTMTRWAYLRADYTSEKRNSNLDRFDINSRSITLQLGLGFFGKPGRQVASW